MSEPICEEGALLLIGAVIYQAIKDVMVLEKRLLRPALKPEYRDRYLADIRELEEFLFGEGLERFFSSYGLPTDIVSVVQARARRSIMSGHLHSAEYIRGVYN